MEAARPGCCPACGAASRPLGLGVVLVGHGVRERQVRGPAAAGSRGVTTMIRIRRYRCRGCEAVTTVVPKAIAARRHFSAAAIGLALALFAGGASGRQVRERVAGADGLWWSWPSLRRWIDAAGRIFRSVRSTPADWSRRRRAERAAATLASFAPVALAGETLAVQAFAGAALAARGSPRPCSSVDRCPP